MQKPIRRLKCGPEFRTNASGVSVMPWNRLDQKMTLHLCESARRTLRELQGTTAIHPVKNLKLGRQFILVDEAGERIVVSVSKLFKS